MARLRLVFVSTAVVLLSLAASTQSFAASSKSDFNWDPKSEQMFARLMCANGEYFRECFSSSQSVCEQAMKDTSRVCDADLVPAQRKKLKSEVQLFAEIGVCVGTKIEKKWRDRKAATTKCDRKENWQ